MEEFNRLGVWWLPNSPKRQIGGIIEYSHKNGLSLKLGDVAKLHDVKPTEKTQIDVSA